MWYLYILRCSDGSLYTGVTTDIKRRTEEHNSSILGSKYTRARRPVALVFKKMYKTRSKAQKEEVRIKKLSKSNKEKLILK